MYAGGYPRAVIDFGTQNRDAVGARPNALVPIFPLWRGGGRPDTRCNYERTDWNNRAKIVDEFTAADTPSVRAPTAA